MTWSRPIIHGCLYIVSDKSTPRREMGSIHVHVCNPCAYNDVATELLACQLRNYVLIIKVLVTVS